MSGAKHTPGPWTIEAREDDDSDYEIIAAGGSSAAGAAVATVAGLHQYPCADREDETEMSSSRLVLAGDAALIAAAPDLLAACEAGARYDAALRRRIVDGEINIIDTGGAVAMGDDLDALFDDWTAKVGAAIAKATGGAP